MVCLAFNGLKAEPAKVGPAPTVAPVEVLLQTAKKLQENGDTNTALISLRQALSLAPNNPKVIHEIGVVYESMGLVDKAAIQWERLVALGPKNNVFYASAQGRLRPKPLPDVPGFLPGSQLALGELKLERVGEPGSSQKILLKIPIKARPGSFIDGREVAIQIIFYDLLPDAGVAQTSANVSHKFSTPPTDWKEEGVEVLVAEYSQPQDDPRKTERKYFGYSVSLYYKNALQDKRAEPSKLLEKYPVPLKLDPEGA